MLYYWRYYYPLDRKNLDVVAKKWVTLLKSRRTLQAPTLERLLKAAETVGEESETSGQF